MEQSELLPAIERFLVAEGMSPVTFGRKALSDPHFVRDVRKGRRLWPETERKVRDFIDRYERDAPQNAAA